MLFLHNRNVLILILLLTLYQISTLSWMGINRYFVPTLIYLSSFFSFGVYNRKDIGLLEFIKKEKNIKLKTIKNLIIILVQI